MVPNSPVYFVFVAVVFVLYWACSGHRILRLSCLFAANLFFLAHFGLFYPLLIVGVATVDHFVALGLFATPKNQRFKRIQLLTISIVLNLGLLLATKVIPLRLNSRYDWIFPLSLSFFCFQSLTYTIDAYRGTAKETRSYLVHLVATSLFISIVAGPINRISKLIGDLESPVHLSRTQGGRALLLIGTGLIKKLLIADFLADNIVNRVFDTPTLYSGVEALVAAYGYSLQLLFDFSGYTDVALGIALLFGIQMPDNFDRPYLSESIREFWRRWHITFSDWLRDYLYFPLGGSRGGRLRTSFNLFATMALGGLWHGVSWTFVVWGGLHGSALAIVHYYRAWRGPRKSRLWVRIVSGVVTFHFVTFCWIFFRASSLSNALAMLQRIVSGTHTAPNLSLPLFVVLVLAVGFHSIPRSWSNSSFDIYGRAPFYVQGAVLALLILAIQFLAGHGSAKFVYANF